MAQEVRELRARWQSAREAVLRAGYNQAAEEIARALYFAGSQPLISGRVESLRRLDAYEKFDPKAWLENRPVAAAMGSGSTNTKLSLDYDEHAAQCLKILEMATEDLENGEEMLWRIGMTVDGEVHDAVDSVRRAIEAIFEPFFRRVDAQLRTLESIITPFDIMKDLQGIVDNQASARYPDAHKLLQDSYRQLFSLSANPGSVTWNAIAYNCRHCLVQFASDVFDPTYVPDGQSQPKGDDAKAKLKWAARHHLKRQGAGDQYRDSVESIIQANWDFVNATGHRQESTTENDARLAVLYSYLTIKMMDDLVTA